MLAAATLVEWRTNQSLENHLCARHQRTSGLLSGLFLSDFPIKFFIHFSSLLIVLHAKLSHLSRLHRHKNVWRSVQNVRLLIMQYSAAPPPFSAPLMFPNILPIIFLSIYFPTLL